MFTPREYIDLEHLLRSLAGEAKVCVESVQDENDGNKDLLPEEAALLPNASPARLREFAAGRRAARTALSRLGFANAPVLRDRLGAPEWPLGVVGSIAHTSACAAAVVASLVSTTSVGIDIEDWQAIEEVSWPTILTPGELSALRAFPDESRGFLVLLVFCAKEAAYKCQYPLTGAFLEFQDVEVELGPETFMATIDRRRVLRDEPFRVTGRFGLAQGLLAAVATAPSFNARFTDGDYRSA